MQVIVTDLQGYKLYLDEESRAKKYIFGNNFAAGIYFVHVIQDKLEKTVKLIKLSK